MSEVVELRTEGRLTNSPKFANRTVGTVVWPLDIRQLYRYLR